MSSYCHGFVTPCCGSFWRVNDQKGGTPFIDPLQSVSSSAVVSRSLHQVSYVIGAVLIIVGALLIKHGWDKSMPKVIAGILALVLGISIVAVRATGAGCGS